LFETKSNPAVFKYSGIMFSFSLQCYWFNCFVTVAHIEKFDWADKPGDEDKPVARTAQQWDSSKGSIFVQTFCEVLKCQTDMEIHKLTLEVNSKIKGYIDYINNRKMKTRNSELNKTLELPVCTSQLRNHFHFNQVQKELHI
jgi:hypothetical protein